MAGTQGARRGLRACIETAQTHENKRTPRPEDRRKVLVREEGGSGAVYRAGDNRAAA